MHRFIARRVVALIHIRPTGAIAACVAAGAIALTLGACRDDPTTAPQQTRLIPNNRPLNDLVPNGAPQLDAGGKFTCAVRSDARVFCWGANAGQQLNVPAGLSGVIQVTAGQFHACALLTTGLPRCWGANFSDPNFAQFNYGQTGVPANNLAGFQQIVAGDFNTCLLHGNGNVTCWGRDDYGQSTVPAGLSGVTQLSAATLHTCALRGDGTVTCWGASDASMAVPADLANVVQITAGGDNSCALTSTGQVTCWGHGTYGETTVPPSLTASQVSAGLRHVCALRTTGTVVCWGNNSFGQTTVPAGLSGVTQVSAGEIHTCALKADLSVVCWGSSGALPPASLANHPPSVTLPDTMYFDEGVWFTVDSHGADPDPNTTLSFTWIELFGSGVTSTWSGGAQQQIVTNGSLMFRLTVIASDGQLADTTSSLVFVRNVPPRFVNISAPAGPMAAGAPLTISGNAYDQGQIENLGVGVRWGEGQQYLAAQVTQQPVNYNPAINRPFTTTRNDLTPGVYELALRVGDPYGASTDTTLSDFLVVYDPSGGYVTGKGAIRSPLGACRLTCAGAEGRASFGFTSKYANGATVPTGTTQFEFKAGNLDFVSTAYQWLTVAGARAQFKGDGAINGAGSYGFLLTAIDGDVAGGGGADKFRIKIWEKSSGLVVYDNQMDASDAAEPTTTLSSGSIIIKK